MRNLCTKRTFKEHSFKPKIFKTILLFFLIFFAIQLDVKGQADCCDQGDKPNGLTFTYIGGGCPGNNSQGSKSDCFGGSVNSSSVFIQVTEKDDGGGDQYFSGTVNNGETFSFNSVDDDFPSKIFLFVGNQTNEIHTSCSAPLVVGETFGALQLDFVSFKNGVDCGPPPPPECDNVTDGGIITGDEVNCDPFNPAMIMSVEEASGNSNPGGGNNGGNGQDCCDQGDKPIEITFTYVGGGCPGNNTQGSKSECSGGAVNNSSVFITASEKDDGSGDIYFSGNVALGESFTISNGGDKFKSKTFISLGNQLNNIHTSCSAPIIVGETFGALRIDYIIFEDGFQCGLPPEPPTEYQWIQSTTGCPDNINQAIPGATGLTYNPPFISETTWYVRLAKREFCEDDQVGATEGWIASNCVKKEIEICDPCIGQGGDSDNDGICNNQDCAPFDPNFPMTPGTPCNDFNPNTFNDVIQADGCNCAGTLGNPCAGQGGDSDGDGVCNNQDCEPFDSFFPTTPGTSCDDGNPNTVNDVVQSDGCSCAGTPVSSCTVSVVSDGCNITISNINDSGANIKVFNPGWNGIAWSCNPWQGNPCENTEVITGLPNGSYPVSIITNACSESFIVVIDCGTDPCAGQGGDSDNDSVCNNQDCQPFNPAFPATPGTQCDDGNPNTVNDVITADGCDCQGVSGSANVGDKVFNDLDEDGIQDPNETGVPNVTVRLISPGPDGQFHTADDIIEDTEVTNGNGNYLFPNVDPGVYCILFEPSSIPSGFVFSPANTTNDGNDSDADAAGKTNVFTVSPGQSDLTRDAGIYQGSSCANQGGDSDGDGVCNNQDCQPFNANFPTTPGNSCDDGNPNTINDVVQSDGCSCAGTPVGGGCNVDVQVSSNGCDVVITGLTDPVTNVKIFDNSNWNRVFQCNPWEGNPCTPTEIVSGLPNATYLVSIYTIDGAGQEICNFGETVIINCNGGGPCDNQGGDSDGDGVCNNQDCEPFNATLPALPGTPCNDGNSNTTNDMIQNDGCTCAGTPIGGNDCNGNTTNLALNKSTQQSSTITAGGITGSSSKAVDGNTNGVFFTNPPSASSVSATNFQNEAWWEVDLGGTFLIEEVRAYNRTDGADKTGPCYLLISDTPFPSDLAGARSVAKYEHFENSELGTPSIDYPNVSGRYVRIQLVNSGYLTLAEVEVIGCVPPFNFVVPNMLNFDVEKAGAKSEISWLMSQDADIDFYEVEVSTDAQEFRLLDQVESMEANAPRNYYATDFNPAAGENFYRLRVVYQDGSFYYTDARRVNFDIDFGEIVVYPNPTNDFLNMTLRDFGGKQGLIEIYNNLGQTQYRQEYTSLPSVPLTLDVSKYVPGIYTISIKVENQRRFAKQFVVVDK